MSIIITVRDEDTQAMLGALRRWLEAADYVTDAGETVLRRSREAFSKTADPNTGTGWAPLAPNTLLKKKRSTILIEDGALIGSLFRGGASNVWTRSSKRRLVVGTRDKKALVHQMGGTRFYTIRPKKRSGFLRFPMLIDGVEMMFVGKSVNHPPMTPRPFFADGEPTAMEIEVEMARRLENILVSRRRAG